MEKKKKETKPQRFGFSARSGHDPSPAEHVGVVQLFPLHADLSFSPCLLPSHPSPCPCPPVPTGWWLLSSQKRTQMPPAPEGRRAPNVETSTEEGQEGAASQPAPLNPPYYHSHFANYLIAAISPRLSQSDTHRCGRPRQPTL